MNAFWTHERITGRLLAALFLLALLALVILIASGTLSAFSELLGASLATKAPFASTFRLTTLL